MSDVGAVGSPSPIVNVDSVKTEAPKPNPEAQAKPEGVALAKDQVSQDVKKGMVPGVNIELYEVVKKPVANVAIGVGAVGVTTAIWKAANSEVGLKSLITLGPKPHISSTLSAGLIGAGAGILMLDAKDQKSKEIKNHVGSFVLGTGSGALVSNIARASFTESKVTNASPSIAIYGGLLALGISLANTAPGSRDKNLATSAAAGALIGTSVAGIGGAAIRTLAADALRMSTVSVVALGAVAGLGIGIAVASGDSK